MMLIQIERISPNRNQPRERFDQEELEDLASSIKTAGVLQPILVRDGGEGRFELIAGERRWRAAKLAGLERVPAIVQKAGDEQSLEIALIENIQRQQLNPIEEARAFSQLMSIHGLTQEAVAERVGRKRSSIANTLRFLKLPDPVQGMIREGTLTSGHAKALLALKTESEILKAAERMVAGEVTVREAEEIARTRIAAALPKESKEEGGDPNVRDAEVRLQRALGTKVRIKGAEKGKGHIEIDFYSTDELERLFDLLEGGVGSGI
ncbi:MAG: ParB/RepB/Spo0J family partition protein [Candidatus Polarisedimenticolia bacterium]